MSSRIKVSAVSYSNTLPFLKGLELSGLGNQIDLSLDIPSECAQKLITGEVDLGLVPVAVIPQLKTHHIVSDYCIGANGAVDTVLLLSDVPIEEVNTIYLDYQSRTSVVLAQVLAKELWQVAPNWLPSEPGYESLISGQTAGVVIGDRTFDLASKFEYVYDLSYDWKELTGKPFVFACWVSNKELPSTFIEALNSAFQQGLNSIGTIVQESNSSYDLYDYLTNKIDYQLDQDKREALDLFLAKMSSSAVLV